jgi:hypothetical protein
VGPRRARAGAGRAIGGLLAEAARLMHNMIVADDLVEFLTLPAYELLD